MPILKKHQVKNYLENYQDIDEHSPFFDPYLMTEKDFEFKEKPRPVESFWKRWWAFFKLKL